MLRQSVLVLAIPLNLSMVAWMIFGPGLFTTLAWTAQVTLLASPIFLTCLTITTVMMFRQRRRPVRLTSGQAWAQIAGWAAMFTYGAALGDTDAMGSYESPLMKLFGGGKTLKQFSALLWWISVFGDVIAWTVLLAKLQGPLYVCARPLQSPPWQPPPQYPPPHYPPTAVPAADSI